MVLGSEDWVLFCVAGAMESRGQVRSQTESGNEGPPPGVRRLPLHRRPEVDGYHGLSGYLNLLSTNWKWGRRSEGCEA